MEVVPFLNYSKFLYSKNTYPVLLDLEAHEPHILVNMLLYINITYYILYIMNYILYKYIHKYFSIRASSFHKWLFRLKNIKNTIIS